jgi:hypothetical protein
MAIRQTFHQLPEKISYNSSKNEFDIYFLKYQMMDGMLFITLLYFLLEMLDMKEVWDGVVYMFSGLSMIPGCLPFRETFWVFSFCYQEGGLPFYQEHFRRTSRKHRVAYKGSPFLMGSITFPMSLIVHFLIFCINCFNY